MTSTSLSKLALAGTFALALSAAFSGMAEARGGGGGGGGGGGPGDFSSSDRIQSVQVDVPPTRRRAYVTSQAGAAAESCTFSRYYQTMVCERAWRR